MKWLPLISYFADILKPRLQDEVLCNAGGRGKKGKEYQSKTKNPKNQKNPAAKSSIARKEKVLVCKKRKQRKRSQYDHSYEQWSVNLSRERIDGKTKKRKTERK